MLKNLFFDYLKETETISLQDRFDFVTEIGNSFLNSYVPIVEKRKEFKKTYPNAVGYPHVVIDGVEHGGLVNVAKYLVKNGHVSTKKG